MSIKSLNQIFKTHSFRIFKNEDNYKEYLRFSSNIYKYGGAESIMIYSQAPKGSIFASFDQWNKFGRYINKGAKGIKIFDTKLRKEVLLFEYGDTNSYRGKEPYVWSYPNSNYEISIDEIGNNIREQIDELDLDLNDLIFSSNEVKDFIYKSSMYRVLTRCELPTDHIEFDAISIFNTDLTLISRINTASCHIAGVMLKDIEKEIKKEMDKHVQLHNQQSRVTRTNDRNAQPRESREVRNDIPELPRGEETIEIRKLDIRRKNSSVENNESGSDGQSDSIDGGNVSERNEGLNGHNRDLQNEGSTEAASGRNSNNRILRETIVEEVQQNEIEFEKGNEGTLPTETLGSDGERSQTRRFSSERAGSGRREVNQLSLFDDSNEIEEELSEVRIKNVLLRGNNVYGGKERIYEYILENQSISDIANFVKTEYGTGGGSLYSNDDDLKFVYYDSKGIRITWINKVGNEVDTLLSWNEVAMKLKELVVEEKYLANPLLAYNGNNWDFNGNIEALRSLKKFELTGNIDSLGRHYLRHYKGWGGMPQAFDPNNKRWNVEYNLLKELLTPEEYEQARASVNNSHYTPIEIVRKINEALLNMGLTDGDILEPSMGTGKFFEVLPGSMKNCRLHGVELDGLTGRIAKALYPSADIQIKGFEETEFDDNSFDAVIGNVPFGQYKVFDPKYNKHNLNIHDYFFIKSLDKLKPGGVLAFITSRYTLDKENDKVRKLMSEQANFLGAVRLPNTAFKSANTDVTSDIIFLQKKDSPYIDEDEQTFVRTSRTEDGFALNEYFIENPHMMLGEMVIDERRKGMYGENSKVATLMPFNNSGNLEEQLEKALRNIKGSIKSNSKSNVIEKELSDILPANPSVKNFSYTVINNQIYYRENSKMFKSDATGKKAERIKGLHKVRIALRNVIDVQVNNCTDSELKNAQDELSKVYDTFVKQNGHICLSANKSAFKEDDDYFLLTSLELEKEGKYIKADIFNKRTIKPGIDVEQVATPREALIASLNIKGNVDFKYMERISPFNEQELIEGLKGEIFKDPETNIYVHSAEYLSGDVRSKLNIARVHFSSDESLTFNIEALEKVLPTPIPASDIDVRIGTPWIELEDYELFMYEKFETPSRYRSGDLKIGINFNNFDGSFSISRMNLDRSIAATGKYGTSRISAYKVFEETLNLKMVVVKDRKEDSNGNVTYVTNKKETLLAREKQNTIKREFKDWIFSDGDRRKKYENLYNTTFNNIRQREYDGSHLTFPGMNVDIKLRPHQKDAIARTIYGGNTLLGHCVGAGKTYEMIASAMEMKRIGLTNKSLFVVPNHLTEQIGNDFIKLYPSANICVATKKDFETSNRKKFIGRIATCEYDAVIMSHSQFSKIPISKEREIEYIRSEIESLSNAISSIKREKGENWSIKQMENMKKNMEANLKILLDTPKDDHITFEELGVNSLFVDEAHEFKNCSFYTKMRNIAGLSNSKAKKASDMLMKCRYLNEVNNYKGVVFATGTPISNSMAELFVMQRYLQNNELEKRGIHHFDSWAAQFGDVVSSLELAPEGQGYRFRNRFSKFTNLPELMSMFKLVADIKTPDMLDLPVPKLKDDKYILVSAEPSDFTDSMMDEFVVRAEDIRNGSVKPHEDNMLKITNEARLLGTDPRLLDPFAENEPDSKVNKCCDNVYEEYIKSKDRSGVQVIFCDVGTPNADKPFNVYDYIKERLIELGVNQDEICFIHDAKTEVQKDKMFEELRKGEKRVIIGSTAKMGTGTNIQNKLVALHHVDCPYRPSDIEQREGRILRQGNENDEVNIYRYVTKGTFDSYMWQLVEQKQKFISQVMTSKSTARSCEDLDEVVLSYAEVKALATGNPLIKEKMEIDTEVSRLQMLKAEFMKTKYQLEDNYNDKYPSMIKEFKQTLELVNRDIKEHVETDDFEITLNGNKVIEKEEAGSYLKSLILKGTFTNVGEYKGYKINLRVEEFGTIKARLDKNHSYYCEFGASGTGNITRMDNAISLEKMNGIKQNLEKNIEYVEANMKQAEEMLNKDFDQEELLNSVMNRQAELNEILSLDDKDSVIGDESDIDDAVTEAVAVADFGMEIS